MANANPARAVPVRAVSRVHHVAVTQLQAHGRRHGLLSDAQVDEAVDLACPLQRSELPDATPQMNVLQRVGGSIGTALLAVVLQRALIGVHTLSGAAAAYGTAFWVSAGLTAIAIVPCIILVRAERAARAAKREQALSPDAMAEAVAA